MLEEYNVKPFKQAYSVLPLVYTTAELELVIGVANSFSRKSAEAKREGTGSLV